MEQVKTLLKNKKALGFLILWCFITAIFTVYSSKIPLLNTVTLAILICTGIVGMKILVHKK